MYFEEVKMLLSIQQKEALWWRNARLLYFQIFSKMPLPAGFQQPGHGFNFYKDLNFSYAPGIGGNQ